MPAVIPNSSPGMPSGTCSFAVREDTSGRWVLARARRRSRPSASSMKALPGARTRWYAASKSIALTPGHQTPEGKYRTFDPGAAILAASSAIPPVPCASALDSRSSHRKPASSATCHGPGAGTGQGDLAYRSQQPVRWLSPQARGSRRRHKLTNPERATPAAYLDQALFLKSKGALSCLTCHPAHAAIARRQRTTIKPA